MRQETECVLVSPRLLACKGTFRILLDLYIFRFYDLVKVTKLSLYVTFDQISVDKYTDVLYIIITINQ